MLWGCLVCDFKQPFSVFKHTNQTGPITLIIIILKNKNLLLKQLQLTGNEALHTVLMECIPVASRCNKREISAGVTLKVTKSLY